MAKALQFSVLITKTFLPEKLEVVLSTVGESGFLLIENVVISLGESAPPPRIQVGGVPAPIMFRQSTELIKINCDCKYLIIPVFYFNLSSRRPLHARRH